MSATFVGEIAGPEGDGERGQHDEEREQRHQRRTGAMLARDRPAVVGVEAPIGVDGDP